jgi:hypothetical protein
LEGGDLFWEDVEADHGVTGLEEACGYGVTEEAEAYYADGSH